MVVTIGDIESAQTRIRNVVRRTPLIHSFSLSRRVGCDLHLKAEMLQRTGSFKLRGAYNMIVQLSPAQRERGVIAASAGNHAQGVAVAAAMAKTPAVVVMPETAPHSKVAASRAYGAEVILHGEHFRDATARAAEIQRERALVLIHGFDAPEIIAGQGGIGLEIMEDFPDIDDVIVPVGGGGLISGIAVAIKSVRPAVRIIGVQAERAASLVASLAAGKPVTTPVADTIADGIAVERPGDLPFAIIRRYVDDVVAVKDEDIEEGIRLLLQGMKLLAEGAGAAALAAIVSDRVRVTGRRVALVLSGGNIDLDVLARVIGRRVRPHDYHPNGWGRPQPPVA